MIRDSFPVDIINLAFRYLLEKHDFGQQIGEIFRDQVKYLGMRPRQVTIFDTTFLSAPSPTKQQSRDRDPDMHLLLACNLWYCRMKVYIGVEV
jgi:IS5 family transposase